MEKENFYQLNVDENAGPMNMKKQMCANMYNLQLKCMWFRKQSFDCFFFFATVCNILLKFINSAKTETCK